MFTTPSQQMLTTVKYVTYEKFCFQQDITPAHRACNTLKLQVSELSTSFFLIMAFNLTAHTEMKPTDYEIQRFTH